jgi:hypothetical protein
LPLAEQYPFWERIGLLGWWLGEGHSMGSSFRRDPGGALSLWRTVKLARGYLRHPEREVRVLGCQYLLTTGLWQDECWSQLSPEDQAIWSDGGLIPAEKLMRGGEQHAMQEWEWAAARKDTDMMRLFTTVNRPQLRAEFCRLFEQRFPNDHDNGCPADRPPPATIVTEAGDVPLLGPWPVVLGKNC